MTKKLACPVCGGLNPRSAQRCETCGAVFETLPEELRPLANELQPDADVVSSVTPESEESSLDWLRSLIPPPDPDSEFEDDGDLDAHEKSVDSSGSPDLLGELFPEIRESLGAEDGSSAADDSGNEEDPFAAVLKSAVADDSADTGVEPESDPEENEDVSEFADFETVRPQPKWETEPIPASERADDERIDGENSDPVKTDADSDGDPSDRYSPNEEKSAGVDADADDGAEPEESYFDFSLHRPQQKWDNEAPSAAKTELKVDRADSAGDEPDDDPNGKTVGEFARDDPAFGAENGETEDEYNDFSHHRPQRKWDDDGGDLSVPAEKSAETEPAAADSDADTCERDGDRQDVGADQHAYVDFSVYRPQDKVADDTETLEAKGEPEADAPFLPEEESSLVSAFLANLYEENADTRLEPEAKPAPPGEALRPEDVADPNLTGEIEPEISAAYDEISEIWTPVSESETIGEETQTEPDRTEAKSDAKTTFAAANESAANENDADALIPDTPKTDGLDEIPWNLFDSGEMNFPSVPNARRDPLTAITKANADAADYQQRMVAGILGKVFRAERRGRGFSDPRTRAKNRLAIIFFALFAVCGVLIILSGNFRIGIAELPGRSDSSGIAAFAERIDSASNADRFEIIFDYTFAYEAAFNRTAQSVIERLRTRDAQLTILAANDAAYSLIRELYPERGSADALSIAYVPGPLGALTLTDGRENADAAIIFAADAARMQRWIEIYRLVRPELPLYLVSGDQSAAILQPFTRSEAIAGALLTQDEMASFRGDTDLSPTRRTALWFLIGTALAAIFLGVVAREPFMPVIAPAPTDGANLTDSNEEDDAEKPDSKGDRDA